MTDNNQENIRKMSKGIYKYVFMAVVGVLALTACGGEDDLTPSNAEVNGFAPAAGDNSATARLRNEFYKETGAYLLFNDISYTNYYGGTSHVDYLLATRGFVISCDNGAMYDDPEGFFSDMMANIVIDKFGRQASSVTDKFYEYSKGFYGDYLSEHDIDATIDNVEWQYGFMEKFDDIWGGSDCYFPYEKRDLQDWVNAVLAMSRDEFVAKYGSSQVMVNKYDTIKGIIEQMGFNI